jgi:hypothetical protein
MSSSFPLTFFKRSVKHFTPKMANSYVGLLNSGRAVGGDDDSEVAVRS